MTRCGACGGSLGPEASICMLDGVAISLCLGCQPDYPREKQYHPTNGPTRRRWDLSEFFGGGR